MAKSINELRKKIKPEVKAAARAKAVGIIAEMTLAEVRQERRQSQTALARAMKVAQSNVSQVENRSDTLISTLGQYVNALGGKLEIRAKFPDGQEVEIIQFNQSTT